ncbi:MAG: hypothetical protein MJ092_00600 [Lachnospiraceae bacterium]|nr:hypothetical protein [Lachnospiraceae bacterium]
MSDFRSLNVVDNFYQNNLFFPMPTVAISTLCEDGSTTIGSYSLVFPYYIAGKDYYAMILEARNSSNTAQNILKNGKCALNFIKDDKKYFKELVRLGFPGKTPAEKMKDCWFELIPGEAEGERPLILKDAYQVIECTWDDSLEDAYKAKEHIGELEGVEPPYNNFNGITSKFGCHFILKIDKILMEAEYADALKNGVKANSFPAVPVDYGYHDSKNFWYKKFKGFRPTSEPIATSNSADVDSVMYCAERLDTKVKFTKEACELYTKIPRPFMKAALLQVAEIAEANGIEVIDKAAAEKIAEIKKKMK